MSGLDTHRQAEAHPRSRGENSTAASAGYCAFGSSPLTRGKRGPRWWACEPSRLIPAHAGKTTHSGPSAAPSAAHPRSRGENPVALSFPLILSGSSPLTRGKPLVERRPRLSLGLIPAHAGKTPPPRRPSWTRPAHPRSRGENRVLGGEQVHLEGSSPLTRGKQGPRPVDQGHAGLIPAHAGKTQRRESCAAGATAHPRSRGENLLRGRTRMRGPGSSPLTRGKRTRPVHAPRRRGLIPAHAGKTLVTVPGTMRSPAHPRSRGENTPPADVIITTPAHPRSRGENGTPLTCRLRSSGSSPLTRGKPSTSGKAAQGWRLIPAHAGKTAGRSTSSMRQAAHPRSRGENRTRARDLLGAGGSSPLTRGKRGQRQVVFYRRGLIPAHAGKTRMSVAACSAHSAHPRSRGENVGSSWPIVLLRGSSPLTRGKRSCEFRRRLRRGLIPAHAGKTLSDLRFYQADRSDLGNP